MSTRTWEGAALFAHVYRMGLEGIVSKRLSAPYRSGRSRDWLVHDLPLKCQRQPRCGDGECETPIGWSGTFGCR